METEVQLIAKRASLHWLAHQHPDWTQHDLATAVGQWLAWVIKWLTRLREAGPGDVMAFHARSRARTTPPASIASQTAGVPRMLEIGEHPPENLQRVRGPEAILYALHRDPELQQADVRLPRAQTTIWKILRLFACIAQEHRRPPRPLPRKQPGEEVQLDLKDATTVPVDAHGKRQHGGEITHFVDAGTSICLSRSVGGDFDAERLLEVVAQFLREHGLPAMLTFANDPRFVGSASGRDFPSAVLRFLLCVGGEPHVGPPHRPDQNAYVQRFHRTLGAQCLRVQLPQTLEQVKEVTASFLHHYNDERPNAARSWGNPPPGVACPTFGPWPAVPETIDPDRWLERVSGQAFVRKVQSDGSLTINHEPYYVPRELAGHQVTCFLNAPEKQCDIGLAGQVGAHQRALWQDPALR